MISISVEKKKSQNLKSKASDFNPSFQSFVVF